MTCSDGFKRFLWLAAGVGLPLALSAESHVEQPGQRAADARVMFKIVIPQVLSLEVGQVLGKLPMPSGAATERHTVVLKAAGHHSSAQLADCQQTGVSTGTTLRCTVSML